MKYIFCFIGFVFYSNFVFSQNFEVQYNFELKEYFKKSSGPNLMYNQARKDVNNYPMEFIVSDKGYSIDFSQSLQVERETQTFPLPKSLALGVIFSFDISIYSTQDTTYSTDDYETIKSFDLNKLHRWEITKETKNILGYKCYKAFFHTDVPLLKRATMMTPIYAWFTPEISLRGGPTYFGNLPGLILELEAKSVHFIASSINKTDKKLKKIDLEGKEVISFIENEKRYMKIGEGLIGN
jgi:GLPGLI family protein